MVLVHDVGPVASPQQCDQQFTGPCPAIIKMSQQLNDALAGSALSRLSQKLPDRFFVRGCALSTGSTTPLSHSVSAFVGEFMTEAINGSYVEGGIVQSPFFPCGTIDYRKCQLSGLKLVFS